MNYFYILTILIFILFIATIIFISYESIKNKNCKKSIKIEKYNVVDNIFSCSIKNNSKYNLMYVVLSIYIFDRNGNNIIVVEKNIGSLLSNETKNLKITLSDYKNHESFNSYKAVVKDISL